MSELQIQTQQQGLMVNTDNNHDNEFIYNLDLDILFLVICFFVVWLRKHKTNERSTKHQTFMVIVFWTETGGPVLKDYLNAYMTHVGFTDRGPLITSWFLLIISESCFIIVLFPIQH